MQKATFIILILACGFLALWLLRDKPPDMEIVSARAALEAARAVEANDYAPKGFRTACDTLSLANSLKVWQDKRFILFRNYGEAKGLYIEAARLAEQAQADAKIGKEQVKKQITDLFIEARQLMDSTFKALEKERIAKKRIGKIKGFNRELVDVLSRLLQLEILKKKLALAVIAYNTGEYVKAKTETEAVIKAVKDIKPKPSIKDKMNTIDKILDQIDTMKSE